MKCLLALPYSLSAMAILASPLGDFEDHADIGSPTNSGSAYYNGASQSYTLAASGVNMWGNRDEFHFVWKKLKGDFILQAAVKLEGQGVDPHRKLGWMVRQNLEEDSPYADAAVHGDGLTSLQFRRTRAAITEQVQSAVKAPNVIQFERKGKAYRLLAAPQGEPFTVCELPDLDLGDEVYVGLFLCSHNASVIERATFHNVRMIRPAPETFRPYRDYLGSLLEVLQVETGERRMLCRSKAPFEAPNWTPDGTALLLNTSGSDPETRGRLIRFDLATRESRIVPTDFATRLNNDHVLSFDGTMIGISDQSAVHGGRSAVFTLPATGGTPKRITAATPSYLHGWSPDGAWLLYTGGRGDEFDVFKIRSDGTGEEINLTRHPGLDDGPEFTPDGRQIYFNSARSGRMQIWRMNADGSDPQQVTDDAYNNWFPHISPDGEWIAFLSFSGEIDPSDHPYYQRVYLRLLPVEGGTPRVIGYVYGGQGTLNVPSWSPDSRMLALVSNSGMD